MNMIELSEFLNQEKAGVEEQIRLLEESGYVLEIDDKNELFELRMELEAINDQLLDLDEHPEEFADFIEED